MCVEHFDFFPEAIALVLNLGAVPLVKQNSRIRLINSEAAPQHLVGMQLLSRVVRFGNVLQSDVACKALSTTEVQRRLLLAVAEAVFRVLFCVINFVHTHTLVRVHTRIYPDVCC